MTQKKPPSSPTIADAVVQQAVEILRWHRVEVLSGVWSQTLAGPFRPDVTAKQLAHRYLSELLDHLYACDLPLFGTGLPADVA